MLGVAFGGALQMATATPLFLELHMNPALVSYVWLCGPVSGLVAQPVIGVLSDRTTHSWGRRRPYIVAGAFFIALAMLLISCATDAGAALGDTNSDRTWAILFAIMGLWILDVACNAVTGPARALLADLAPQQLSVANSIFGWSLGLGNTLGFFAGNVHWTEVLPVAIETEACVGACADLRVSFALGVVCVLLSTAATFAAAGEDRAPAPDELPHSHAHGGAGEEEGALALLWRGLAGIPENVEMLGVVAVQFTTWIAWFCYILYITTWTGVEVFRGDPNSHEEILRLRFEAGVRHGSLGMCANSVASVFASMLLPSLISRMGYYAVWAGGSLLMGFCLLGTAFVRTPEGALLLIATLGLSWAIAVSVPFAIVGAFARPHERGMLFGIVNIFVVVPQLVVSFSMGPILHLFFDGSVGVALLIGGLCGLVGAGLAAALHARRS
eukprot:tig00021314_g20128.t1